MNRKHIKNYKFCGGVSNEYFKIISQNHMNSVFEIMKYE